jgi:hypothetical protein
MNSTHCEAQDCTSWVHGDPPKQFAWGIKDGEPFCLLHFP